MKYKVVALGLLMIVGLVFGSSADMLGIAHTMNVLGVGTDSVQPPPTGRTPSTLLVENRRLMLGDLA